MEENKKFELSEVDVYFLTKDETSLLWNYDSNDTGIWDRRTDFFNGIRKTDKYVLAIDITGPWLLNLFKPKREGEANHDMYAVSTNMNCTNRTFNEFIKAKYKEKFEEELCLTDADENYSIMNAESKRLIEINIDLNTRVKNLQTTIENLNAKSSVDEIAKKKGHFIPFNPNDKDGLSEAQKLIFRGKDPFDEDVKTEDKVEKEEEPNVTNWKAMFHESSRKMAAMRRDIELRDAQFKNLLELFNSREND